MQLTEIGNPHKYLRVAPFSLSCIIIPGYPSLKHIRTHDLHPIHSPSVPFPPASARVASTLAMGLSGSYAYIRTYPVAWIRL